MVSQIVLENPPVKAVNLTWNQGDSTFKIQESELRELKDSELRVKLLYFSNDPTQRGWMSANQDPSRSYVPPILKGDLIRSLGLAEVVESKSSKYAKGDVVTGLFGWSQELVIPESSVTTKVDKSVPYEMYLSTIGLTGLTAYFGLKKVGQLQEGQTVLISAASGATGSMAVQLAKHVFKASKVIGIAGSKDKVEWVKSLGADVCVNYRDADYKEKLHEAIGEEFVDVYFDNVGGEILDFALSHVKRHGRVIACGAIAGYNDSSKFAVHKWSEIITNRITVQGFIVMDFVAEYGNAVQDILGAVKNGSLSADGYSLIDLSEKENPLAQVPSTWNKLFTEEKPRGKLITRIA